ncbi:MAG: putative transporter [Elusimicrobiota bacterium]
MEDFLKSIISNNIISTLFAISLTGLIGLLIGNLKIFNVNIGITGVLFAGIILSQIGIVFDETYINFLREFGLVLFVYAVGMQVGNGFFSSFKKNGIFLNISAILIILGNILMLFLVKKIFNIDNPSLLGIYCGATTNTPALATAQSAASSLSLLISDKISSAYAITYPGAILSLITSMLILKFFFKKEYEQDISRSFSSDKPKIINITAIVENKNLNNIYIKDIPAIDELKIVITRIKKTTGIVVAHPETKINVGDIVLCVGEEKNLEEFIKIIGSKSDIDIRKQSEKIINTRAVVTNKNLIGKKIFETKIPSYGVVITRVSRSDIEFVVSDDYTIQFGDNISIVGEEDNVLKATKFIGNSPKDLNHPDLIPIFIGVISGVFIGMIPIHIPFVSQSVKLGLAGGQLLSAIIFSNLGNIGKISWYIPPASNLMLRELGIIIFLSAVGLKSGNSFFQTILSGNGFIIILSGIIVSIIPIIIAGIIIKKFYKINYLTICGLLSGAMTDPPALAYANSLSDSNLSSISYATVYPMTMFLRIISAQMLVFILYG